MDFLKLLQSLDELLYEVMSWLIFYPVTLWRTLARPLRMMDYSDAELTDVADQQYTDTLSPPLFLLLTLVLIHAIELALFGESEIVRSKVGLDALISNDTNLIVLRAVLFSLFPLVMASRLVRQQKNGLERDTLRAPFYSQCYVAALLALAVSGGQILIRLDKTWAILTGAGLAVAALLWYGTLQAFWFARHLQVSLLRGFWNASLGMVESLIAAAIVGSLFA